MHAKNYENWLTVVKVIYLLKSGCPTVRLLCIQRPAHSRRLESSPPARPTRSEATCRLVAII